MNPNSPQFNSISPIDLGNDSPEIRFGEATGVMKAEVSKKPANLLGSTGDRMKAIASWGQGKSDAAVMIGKPEEGAKTILVGSKAGRSRVAKTLGLPNKKAFRAKKGK